MLMIIDMQPWFWQHNNSTTMRVVINPLITRIRRLVRQELKQSTARILLVEYADCGPTTSRLTDLFDYTDWHRIVTTFTKSDNSLLRCPHYGHQHLQRLKKLIATERWRHGFDPVIRVCGINADACVYETVRDLAAELPDTKIEVLREGVGSVRKCWPHDRQSQLAPFHFMPRPNVVVA